MPNNMPARPDTARLPYTDGEWRFCWFAQIGGYGCPCAIRNMGSACFEIWIWHDGEFPSETPTRFHLCDTIVRDLYGLAVEIEALRALRVVPAR